MIVDAPAMTPMIFPAGATPHREPFMPGSTSHFAATASIIACLAACSHAATTPAVIPVPPHDVVPTGTVHEDVFFSPSLGVRKHLVVYLPPSYGRDSTRRYSVAYYLHGLSGTETDWLSKGSIDVAADSLAHVGAPEMILVMPDGDDGWYTSWVDPVPYATCADTLHVEASDRYCVVNARYDDYIAHDVVAYVDSHYRTRSDRAHRGIGGLSMGGYGAVILALRYPEVFAAAASHSGVVSPLYTGPHPFAAPAQYATTADQLKAPSGSFWPRFLHFWGTDLERWRAADPAHVAEQLAGRGGPMPALFIDCGTEDGLIDENRALDAELRRLAIKHWYAEWPGAHTWRYWSTHVRESLAWMGEQIGR
jgi:putative tributyrin esterase